MPAREAASGVNVIAMLLSPLADAGAVGSGVTTGGCPGSPRYKYMAPAPTLAIAAAAKATTRSCVKFLLVGVIGSLPERPRGRCEPVGSRATGRCRRSLDRAGDGSRSEHRAESRGRARNSAGPRPH